MIIKKELSIKELFDEMQYLKVRLIKLADKYNKSLITVSAIMWKDIIVGGGKKGDIMLNKEIKKNKLLQQALNEIREYAQDLRLYDNDSTDILKIIDEVGGNEE